MRTWEASDHTCHHIVFITNDDNDNNNDGDDDNDDIDADDDDDDDDDDSKLAFSELLIVGPIPPFLRYRYHHVRGIFDHHHIIHHINSNYPHINPHHGQGVWFGGKPCQHNQRHRHHHHHHHHICHHNNPHHDQGVSPSGKSRSSCGRRCLHWVC